MIKNINTNILANSKLKLCTIGTIGMILASSLVGCTFRNRNWYGKNWYIHKRFRKLY